MLDNVRLHGLQHLSLKNIHAGRMPSRGTELCTVVESMWSLVLTAQLATRDQDAVWLGYRL
jgi:hypothetical protein